MRKDIKKLIKPIHLKRKRKTLKVVYPAFSKRYFFLREHISIFVLKKSAVPLNPFINFDYFFADAIPRELVYSANDNFIRLADELWAFGPIADGMAAEIMYAESMGKKIKYFRTDKDKKGIYKFRQTSEKEAELEGG